MVPWYYVWSPKYALFHHILVGQLSDSPGIDVHPVFIQQSVFNRKEGADGKHFLTGIGIKIYVLLKNLEKRPGEFVVFSDVDILCLKSNISNLLESYKVNDITCMRERIDTDDYNIGLMLVKSTPETIALFRVVLERIRLENRLDQDIFMEEIKNFKGKHGHFAIPACIQSNMMRHYEGHESEFSIIQCLSSEMDPNTMMVQKIATMTNFFDITRLRSHIPPEIELRLMNYLQEEDPSNYVLKWPSRLSTDKFA